MNILILANFDLGLYKFRKELLETLIREHTVYTSLPVGEYTEDLKALGCHFIPTPVDRRGMNPVTDLKLLLTYRKLICRIRPDVVLTYTIKPNVYGGLACRLSHTPYLANVTGLGTSIENGGLLGKLSTALYRIGVRKANCVFFQNEDNRRLFIDKKIVKGASRLIPGSGVNLIQHCVEPYPSDENGIRMLFIGRIMKDKGIGELLEAFDAVRRKHPGISLDIVGGCDEDYTERLEKACADGAIRYHGQQRDVHAFIKNAHFTVLPSYHEGMANVMLESAATGRPVITTRVPGCSGTLDEDVTGFACEAKSTDSLIEAMEQMLALDNTARKEMGLRGRTKMENEFDRDKVISAYLEEIGKLG